MGERGLREKGCTMGLLSLRGLRGLVYGLFGGLLLSTLWVTSLTVLSAPTSATALLTDAGTQVLNPFLVDHGLGFSPAVYAAFEAGAHSAPNQPVNLGVLKVRVLGREILGQSYTNSAHLVYARVASGYYAGGAEAVFAIPPQLRQELPNFALFNPDNIPLIQGGPTPAQLPTFVQPLFVFTGLTPATFTAAGHQHLASLLLSFWGLTLVLGLIAVALNLSERKLTGLAHSVIHSTWPVVVLLLGATLAVHLDARQFAAFDGLLAIVRGAFLPVYGAALVIGLGSLAFLTLLPRLRRRQVALAGSTGTGVPRLPTATPDFGLPFAPGRRMTQNDTNPPPAAI